MSQTSTLIGYEAKTIGRESLVLVPTPAPTETHRPIPHHEVVKALIDQNSEQLHPVGRHGVFVVHDTDMTKVETEMEGCRFSIGIRNSHDKSMRLALTCGYRVFVCSNMAFNGEFTRVTMSPYLSLWLRQ